MNILPCRSLEVYYDNTCIVKFLLRVHIQCGNKVIENGNPEKKEKNMEAIDKFIY
jgi:hypothetical protein